MDVQPCYQLLICSLSWFPSKTLIIIYGDLKDCDTDSSNSEGHTLMYLVCDAPQSKAEITSPTLDMTIQKTGIRISRTIWLRYVSCKKTLSNVKINNFLRELVLLVTCQLLDDVFINCLRNELQQADHPANVVENNSQYILYIHMSKLGKHKIGIS